MHALKQPLKFAQHQHHDVLHDLINLLKKLTQLRVTAFTFNQSHKHQNGFKHSRCWH